MVAGFAVGDEDEIMLVTDGGQVIRTPVDKISRGGRGARGVTIFKLAKDEQVVSVARLDESVIGGELDDEEGDEEADMASGEPENGHEEAVATPGDGEAGDREPDSGGGEPPDDEPGDDETPDDDEPGDDGPEDGGEA